MRKAITRTDKDMAAVFFLLLAIGLFFFPLIFEGKALFFRDITFHVYPMKHFIFRAYHEGFLPFWNPAAYSGKPFLAGLVPGALYPPNLIFFLPDFTTAFNGFYISHYVLLTLSVYALVRYLGLSVGAGLCSALTAFLGGFFMSLPGTTALFYSAVWLPSIFYFAQRYSQEKKATCFLGAVFCLACQILGGSPEFSILTVLSLFFWLLTLDPTETGWWQKSLRSGLPVAAMVFLSCGITAIQLVPTFFLTKESTRSDGLSFDTHASWSMEPSDLATLLVPKNYAGFMVAENVEDFSLLQSLYMGLFAVFFLCAGFLYLKRKDVRFWVIVFLVGIFFALGKHNPLYQRVYEWLPLIKLFRYPEKFYFLSAFSQVFLVGYGIDALVKSESKNRAYFWVVLALGLGLAGVALGIPSRNSTPSFAYLAIFGGACALLFSGKWKAWGVKSVLLILISLDLFLNNYMLIPMIDRKFYEEVPKAAREIKKDEGFFRVYVGKIEGPPDALPIPNTFLAGQIYLKEALHPDIGAIHGISYADGIPASSLELQDQRLWTDIFYKSPPAKRLRMLQRSNVKYWIKGEGTPEMEKTIFTPSTVEVLNEALPRAFLVAGFRLGKDPHLLNTYYDESFDPRREVLLSELATLDEVADFTGVVDDIRYGPNQVVIKTHQNGDGLLVLLDSWFPGWTATVDGVPEPIFRANHFYRAVKLASGNHTVRFVYEPVGFKSGMYVTGITALCLFGIWVWKRSPL